MEKITEMIDALVAEKTFSLEGVKAIEAVRAKAEALQRTLESTALERDSARKERELAVNDAAVKARTISEWEQRSATIATREKTMTEKEQTAAVQTATAATFRECFAMVFRNVEVRREMFGTVPPNASANPTYYPPSSVPISETVTTKTE